MDKMKQKMDLDALDELIAKCEDSMVGKFKKHEPEPEPDAMDPNEGAEDESAEPEMSAEEMQELLDEYQAKHGGDR